MAGRSSEGDEPLNPDTTSSQDGADTAGPWAQVSVLRDSEMATALLRIAAGAAALVFLATGGVDDPFDLAWAFYVGGFVYTVVSFVVVLRLYLAGDDYPFPLTATLTVCDNVILIAMAAVSGGVQNLLLGVLLLVITTDAARFGIRAAVAWALIDSVILLTIALAIDEPPLPLADRLRLVGWWTWLLVGGAVIAGVIARAAFEYRHRLDRAEQQAAIDRLDRELAHQARLEVERADAARRDILRVMVHELRTPIASMGALSRALVSGGSRLDDTERMEALTLIESHAGHLSQLLEEVRGLSSAPSVARQVERTDADLGHLVRVSASAAGAPDDRLDVDLSDGVRFARVDIEKMRRILTNLIENAARHSTGTIRVEAGVDGGVLHVAVLDRGSGLSPAAAARAFEKDFGFGTERGSSGLGLWIVRELATAMDGRVWAEPRPGGGLAVRVELPVGGQRP